MVANDLLRIPLVLLMMFTESVAVLLLLQALVCASTALFMPSRQTLIPEVVHPIDCSLPTRSRAACLASFTSWVPRWARCSTPALARCVAWSISRLRAICSRRCCCIH